MSDFELVVFIRHKFSSTNSIIDELWEERIIGVHYEDIESFNADDYKKIKESTRKTLKSIFDLMERIQEKGAIVAADYSNETNKDEKKNKALLVGIIEKGAEKKPLWFTDSESGQKYCYKTMKMKETKEIYYEDHPILFSCKPRQNTMCQWRLMKKKLPSIYYDESLPEKVTSLMDSELEVLCYEYLRIDKLTCLLLPIGRTLDNVDIVGLSIQGKRIFAQVTFANKKKAIESKVNQLLNARKSEKSDLYFFGPEKIGDIVRNATNEINFVSIETVFNKLKSKKETKEAIAIMLNK